ncbi:MAG: phosphate ABC transporter permease subunit PstC [Actinobacteria bacterium]|nr:phosphate ABC transporter permease subunit PstC [Actinomycetota bacterium]
MAATLQAPLDAEADRPRSIGTQAGRSDRIFRGISFAAAAVSLIIIVSTAVFLVLGAREAFDTSGVVNFFTDSIWNPSRGEFGVYGILVGTLLISVVALLVALPLGLGLALFINEYAPMRLRRALTGAVDLLAAMPSLIFGMWGFFVLQEHIVGVAQFFADHLSAIPIFRVFEGEQLTRSGFIAGIIVGFMILPIVTSVSRDVMSQAPREQCEGALALGGTRWGMITSVIFPFARSGIVGATLLGFGRALGETIAITIIVSPVVTANWRILTEGSASVAQVIATRFPEAQGLELSGLVAAGLVLFIVTLIVNLVARRIVSASRAAH